MRPCCPDSACISCFLELGFEPLLRRMWDSMGLVRVYSKKTGNKPAGGCTVCTSPLHFER